MLGERLAVLVVYVPAVREFILKLLKAILDATNPRRGQPRDSEGRYRRKRRRKSR